MASERLEVLGQVKSEETEVRSETGGGQLDNYLAEKPRRKLQLLLLLVTDDMCPAGLIEGRGPWLLHQTRL